MESGRVNKEFMKEKDKIFVVNDNNKYTLYKGHSFGGHNFMSFSKDEISKIVISFVKHMDYNQLENLEENIIMMLSDMRYDDYENMEE